MEDRRSQDHGTTRERGSSRSRGARQAQERGITVESQPGPQAEGEDQVATTIQQMTNILARLVE
mgnify:CR=1 FL=1